MAPSTPGKPATPFGKPGKEDEFFLEAMPEEGGGLRIPKGKYVGRLIDAAKDVAKSSGNPMWVFFFAITEGPHAGRDFRIYAALTPQAMWKVAEVLNALGLGVEPGEPVRFVKKDAIGIGVTMVLEDDEYNGRDTSKLVRVEAHPKGAGYKVKGGVPTPSAAPAATDPGEVEDEDGGAGEHDAGAVDEGDEVSIYELDGKFFLDEDGTQPCDEEGNPLPAPKKVVKKAAPVASTPGGKKGGKATSKV